MTRNVFHAAAMSCGPQNVMQLCFMNSSELGESVNDACRLSHATPGAGVEEHNNKFHHWHQGQDGGVAIQLEEPKLFWCLVRSSMSDLAMRQVLDGGDIVAQFTPSLLDTKVSPLPPPSLL